MEYLEQSDKSERECNYDENQKNEYDDIERCYHTYEDIEKIVHGTKIREGYILQDIAYNNIKLSGKFSTVEKEKFIELNPENKTHRKRHKVDIFCVDENNKKIMAFNSKGKSFNNTESQENLLFEYRKYENAIKCMYKDYEVQYCILKDGYNCTDKRMTKYRFLEANGIKVYNLYDYLKDTCGISCEMIEHERKKKVMKELRKRMKEINITEYFHGILLQVAE